VLKHVVWDWNGTLLDDIDLCVAILNQLVAERQLEPVTRNFYREHFGFPVRDFYEQVGFDFAREDFGELSQLFNARYRSEIVRARLQPGALAALQAVERAGFSQSMVSAMKSDLLHQMLDDYRIAHFFSRVKGLDDLHATSKTRIGVALREELQLDADEMVLIGDTLHDLETAQAIGCRCLLFCGGHQSRKRLTSSGATVLDGLHDLVSVLTCASSYAALSPAE
jgi:phosphoglycolate phosphatase